MVTARPAAPWYVHPAEQPSAWDRLRAGTDLEFAVVNVHNGPGQPGDPYYAAALAGACATRLVGYVPVGYGKRPLGEVLRDVRHWRDWYAVTGILLDEVPTRERQGHWTLDTITLVRACGADFVAVNPGAPPHPGLILAADVTCVTETYWERYRDWEPDAALRDLPAERQWHLVHSVPPERLACVFAMAAARGAAFAWSTTGRLPDPWSSLPDRYL